MNLKGRNFLTLKDFTPEEITYMIDLAADLKAKKKAGELHEYYRGKNIALIFEKTSTRTRCSFEVAAHDLGMGSTYLDPTGSQIGKKESIADTARVLGRMYEGIEYRGFGQDIVEELAKHANIRFIDIDSKCAKKLKASYKFYDSFTIPANTYTGQTKDVSTLCVKSVLLARDDMSEDTVKELTALLFKHAKDFQYSLQADLNFNESDATKGITIPFHPGACAYYKEKGITVSSEDKN